MFIAFGYFLFYIVQNFLPRKKTNNYTEEDLKETYGFLLSETENQVRELDCRKLILWY